MQIKVGFVDNLMTVTFLPFGHMNNFLINQLEKLEAAKAACLVCLSLLSLTGSFLVLLGPSG